MFASHVSLVCPCRKKEAQRCSLTKKVNLQFYYIPVCGAPISSAKVIQLPHVNTPPACDCVKVTSQHKWLLTELKTSMVKMAFCFGFLSNNVVILPGKHSVMK